MNSLDIFLQALCQPTIYKAYLINLILLSILILIPMKKKFVFLHVSAFGLPLVLPWLTASQTINQNFINYHLTEILFFFTMPALLLNLIIAKLATTTSSSKQRIPVTHASDEYESEYQIKSY